MTFRQLIDAVRVEGGVDTTTGGVSETTVKRYLNERYREMVARSQWRLAEINMGLTVVDQAEYSVSSDVVDLRKLSVDGDPFTRVGFEDLWDLKAGTTRLQGSGGVFAPDYTSGGVDQVELYPAPEDAGLTILGLAALQAGELTEDTQEPAVPGEFHERIVDGAIGLVLARIDERLDEAPYYEARFEEATEMLRRRRNTRFGHGAHQLAISGYHF